MTARGAVECFWAIGRPTAPHRSPAFKPPFEFNQKARTLNRMRLLGSVTGSQSANEPDAIGMEILK